MKIIEPSVQLEDNIDEQAILKKIERIGRVRYKSENRITKDSAERFVKSILDRGHESVLEHVSISVRVICDRGVSHEIVRHRVASYSQESTRYCNYSKDKFNNELTFIKPCWFKYSTSDIMQEEDFYDSEMNESDKDWLHHMKRCENIYFDMLQHGATPEQARSILPNSLKTEIVMTMNLREWRHFLKLRTSNRAHPQTREIANMILEAFKSKIPVVFDDIEKGEE